MRNIQGRLAAIAALVVAATGFIIIGVGTDAQATCELRELTMHDVTAIEGSSTDRAEDTIFTFTVSSGGCAYPGKASFAVVGVTADHTDLVYDSGILEFATDDTTDKNILVRVEPDTEPEHPETFQVRLVVEDGKIGLCQPIGTGTIIDDDGKDEPKATPTVQSPCKLHGSR